MQTLQELVAEYWHETDPDDLIPDNIPLLVVLAWETIRYYPAGEETGYRQQDECVILTNDREGNVVKHGNNLGVGSPLMRTIKRFL